MLFRINAMFVLDKTQKSYRTEFVDKHAFYIHINSIRLHETVRYLQPLSRKIWISVGHHVVVLHLKYFLHKCLKFFDDLLPNKILWSYATVLCCTATPQKFAVPLCGFNDDRKSEKYNGRVASSSKMFIQILNKSLICFERSLGGQTQVSLYFLVQYYNQSQNISLQAYIKIKYTHVNIAQIKKGGLRCNITRE